MFLRRLTVKIARVVECWGRVEKLPPLVLCGVGVSHSSARLKNDRFGCQFSLRGIKYGGSVAPKIVAYRFLVFRNMAPGGFFYDRYVISVVIFI